MIDYPKTNILIDDKREFSLPYLYSELDLIGAPWHQNTDNSERKELQYFLGNSSVVVSEFGRKANIKIISKDEIYLNYDKSRIEKILDESRPKKI